MGSSRTSRRRIGRPWAWLLLAFAGAANAILGPPVFEAPLVEGTPIVFSMAYGGCDLLITHSAPPASDASRSVERVGNTIRVIVVGDVGAGLFCNAPFDTPRFSIGVLPAGTYTLEFYRRELQSPDTVTLVATRIFIVARAREVPALGLTALGALAFLLLASARRLRLRATV